MRKGVVIILFFSAVLYSCGKSSFFEASKDIPKQSWHYADPAVFDVAVSDTVSKHHFFLTLRTTESYPYNNLYVFVDMDFPDGKHSRDTIECILANPDGSWMGKESGSLVYNKILFKPSVVFPAPGNYHFALSHGMREDLLTEVTNVGLTIEKVNQ